MISRVGRGGLDLVERDLIVADDPQVELRVDLAEPLDQVIGERVVVINQEDHSDLQWLVAECLCVDQSRCLRPSSLKRSFIAIRFLEEYREANPAPSRRPGPMTTKDQ